MARYWITFGSIFLACFFAIIIIWQDGMEWRIPEERTYPSSKEMRKLESALCQGTDIQNGIQLGKAPNEPIITCSHDIGSDKNIYVWGDSHARHLLAGLISTYPSHNIHILYFTACTPQSGIENFVVHYENNSKRRDACINRNLRAIDFFKSTKAESIIIHHAFGYDEEFSKSWHNATRQIIDTLEQNGHNFAFLGLIIQPGIDLVECLSLPSIIPNWLIARRCKGDIELALQIIQKNNALKEKFPENFIDMNPVFCTTDTSCLIREGSKILFRDNSHLSIFGSNKVIKTIEPRLSVLLGVV